MINSQLLNQSLDFLHQIEPFQFWFIDRGRATIGLPLLIKNDIWKIYRINYGSVAVENGELQRAIAFGEFVSTEGLRSGALVPQRPNDPDDELILLEDRLRRICLDLSENFEIFVDDCEVHPVFIRKDEFLKVEYDLTLCNTKIRTLSFSMFRDAARVEMTMKDKIDENNIF